MSVEWTELAYLEQLSGNTGMVVFAFSVVFVFLVLAALYESWAMPLAVILVVPMCVLCSIAGVAIANMDINIFTQVGFVVLIGLACKNAILIVEFAKYRRGEGVAAREAVMQACQLRLRPILMTSFAFILGVLPLVVATGAGAEMRRALGTAVFAGMLGVTFFGIFLTPVFFYVIDSMSHWHLFTRGPLAHIASFVLAIMQPRRWWQAGRWAASRIPVKKRSPVRPATQRERSKPAEENSVEATIADAAHTSAVSPGGIKAGLNGGNGTSESDKVTTPPTNSPPSQGAAGRE